MYPEEDEYESPDRKDVVFTILIMALFVSFLLLTGCVKVQPEIKPNIASCPTLAMPAVPQKMRLIIDGDKLDADSSGVEFLRYYVKSRQVLK